jgi:hypothetical protein
MGSERPEARPSEALAAFLAAVAEEEVKDRQARRKAEILRQLDEMKRRRQDRRGGDDPR